MKTQFAFCLLFAFCLAAAIATKAQVDVNDSLALVDLYNSTNGPEWYYNDNWLTGPVKTWSGIYLSDNGQRVIEIWLFENNLTGYIPSSLGNISNLEYLYLWNNQLSGTIPMNLGNLANLKILNLTDNQLSGSVPPELGNLSNLSELASYNNQLSGNIPSELGNLSNLFGLHLNVNQLSGKIPPELGNLPSLGRLVSSDNQLSGNIPPELGNLSNLSALILNNNQLSGRVPVSFRNLSNLLELNLSNNQLTGHMRATVGKIKRTLSLQILSLSNNSFTGPIPARIRNFEHLEQLYLDHNQLSGPVPPQIGELINLKSLNLSHNRFTFDGMELVAQKFPFAKYGSQARIHVHINNHAMAVSAGGTLSNNTYTWHEKDKATNTIIAGDSIFYPSGSGAYSVKINNKVATRLTLYSDTVTYSAPSSRMVSSGVKSSPSNNSFSVYPNPAKDVFHVRTNGNASFSLLSQSGKTILTTNINKAGSINVSKLAAGDYYLKNNHTNASKKIAVIR